MHITQAFRIISLSANIIRNTGEQYWQRGLEGTEAAAAVEPAEPAEPASVQTAGETPREEAGPVGRVGGSRAVVAVV